VDSLRVRVGVADPFHRGCETASCSVRRRMGQVTAGLGRHDAEDVGCPATNVFVVALGHSARSHRSSHALGRVQLDRPLIKSHHGLLHRRWLLHQVQHVLHSFDVLAIQLRHAPYFFPATASVRGSSATAGLFPCRPMRRCLVAPPPSPAARATSATARAAVGCTPAPRQRPRSGCRTSSAAHGTVAVKKIVREYVTARPTCGAGVRRQEPGGDGVTIIEL